MLKKCYQEESDLINQDYISSGYRYSSNIEE
jgi:hypothetical protein